MRFCGGVLMLFSSLVRPTEVDLPDRDNGGVLFVRVEVSQPSANIQQPVDQSIVVPRGRIFMITHSISLDPLLLAVLAVEPYFTFNVSAWTVSQCMRSSAEVEYRLMLCGVRWIGIRMSFPSERKGWRSLAGEAVVSANKGRMESMTGQDG